MDNAYNFSGQLYGERNYHPPQMPFMYSSHGSSCPQGPPPPPYYRFLGPYSQMAPQFPYALSALPYGMPPTPFHPCQPSRVFPAYSKPRTQSNAIASSSSDTTNVVKTPNHASMSPGTGKTKSADSFSSVVTSAGVVASSSSNVSSNDEKARLVASTQRSAHSNSNETSKQLTTFSSTQASAPFPKAAKQSGKTLQSPNVVTKGEKAPAATVESKSRQLEIGACDTTSRPAAGKSADEQNVFSSSPDSSASMSVVVSNAGIVQPIASAPTGQLSSLPPMLPKNTPPVTYAVETSRHQVMWLLDAPIFVPGMSSATFCPIKTTADFMADAPIFVAENSSCGNEKSRDANNNNCEPVIGSQVQPVLSPSSSGRLPVEDITTSILPQTLWSNVDIPKRHGDFHCTTSYCHTESKVAAPIASVHRAVSHVATQCSMNVIDKITCNVDVQVVSDTRDAATDMLDIFAPTSDVFSPDFEQLKDVFTRFMCHSRIAGEVKQSCVVEMNSITDDVKQLGHRKKKLSDYLNLLMKEIKPKESTVVVDERSSSRAASTQLYHDMSVQCNIGDSSPSHSLLQPEASSKALDRHESSARTTLATSYDKNGNQNLLSRELLQLAEHYEKKNACHRELIDLNQQNLFPADKPVNAHVDATSVCQMGRGRGRFLNKTATADVKPEIMWKKAPGLEHNVSKVEWSSTPVVAKESLQRTTEPQLSTISSAQLKSVVDSVCGNDDSDALDEIYHSDSEEESGTSGRVGVQHNLPDKPPSWLVPNQSQLYHNQSYAQRSAPLNPWPSRYFPGVFPTLRVSPSPYMNSFADDFSLLGLPGPLSSVSANNAAFMDQILQENRELTDKVTMLITAKHPLIAANLSSLRFAVFRELMMLKLINEQNRFQQQQQEEHEQWLRYTHASGLMMPTDVTSSYQRTAAPSFHSVCGFGEIGSGIRTSISVDKSQRDNLAGNLDSQKVSASRSLYTSSNHSETFAPIWLSSEQRSSTNKEVLTSEQAFKPNSDNCNSLTNSDKKSRDTQPLLSNESERKLAECWASVASDRDHVLKEVGSLKTAPSAAPKTTVQQSIHQQQKHNLLDSVAVRTPTATSPAGCTHNNSQELQTPATVFPTAHSDPRCDESRHEKVEEFVSTSTSRSTRGGERCDGAQSNVRGERDGSSSSTLSKTTTTTTTTKLVKEDSQSMKDLDSFYLAPNGRFGSKSNRQGMLSSCWLNEDATSTTAVGAEEGDWQQVERKKPRSVHPVRQNEPRKPRRRERCRLDN